MLVEGAGGRLQVTTVLSMTNAKATFYGAAGHQFVGTLHET